MARCRSSPEVGTVIVVIGTRETEGAAMSSRRGRCHVIVVSWEKTRERKRGGRVVVVVVSLSLSRRRGASPRHRREVGEDEGEGERRGRVVVGTRKRVKARRPL